PCGAAGCGLWQGAHHSDDGRGGSSGSMTTWALLAPGPSASAEQAERVRDAGIPLGAVGCAYHLAPWADFIASSDASWWRKYPEAVQIPKRYAMHLVKGVETVKVPSLGTICNSGVLALECSKRL